MAVLAGCQSSPQLEQLVARQAVRADWISSGPFELLVVRPPATASHSETLHVYLGGDGRPWRDQTPAADPSGTRALAVELMLRDASPALFLGRPCYHQPVMSEACDPALWTGARYSREVVAALAGAIETLARQHRARNVTLIGYSGGGALAVLVAARVEGLASVSAITVAANLDHSAWTRHHRLLPLADSMNPLEDSDDKLAAVHLQGESDRVVPPATTDAYRAAHPRQTLLRIPGFDHRCCWVRDWPALLAGALVTLQTGPRPVNPLTPAPTAPRGRS